MNDNWNIILQVSKTASLNEIRNAYKQLALKYHPDKNNGEDSFFKSIVNAYEYRLRYPEYNIKDDCPFRETDTSLQLLEYLYNLRILKERITTTILKNLTISYSIKPFNMNVSSYINVIFSRLSCERICDKLDKLGIKYTADLSREQLIDLFLYSKINQLHLNR